MAEEPEPACGGDSDTKREERTMTTWEIHGREFVNCNCAYGCPCQFNALPTDGTCRGVGALAIDRGHHDKVDLSGLKAIWMLDWPGPIHEGNGTVQLIVDERASEAQRSALIRILSGEDTEPGATVFQVFAATFTTVHDPEFLPIDFEVDVDERTARLIVPGLIEGAGEPIRNPVTGETHRARIDLPHGFEYSLAEMGRGTSRVKGRVPMDLEDSYGQFAQIRLSNTGIVRDVAA